MLKELDECCGALGVAGSPAALLLQAYMGELRRMGALEEASSAAAA